MEEKDKLPHVGGYSKNTKTDAIIEAVFRLFDKKSWKPLIMNMIRSGVHSGIDRMFNGASGTSTTYYQQSPAQQAYTDYKQMFANNLFNQLTGPVTSDIPPNVYPMENSAKAYMLRDAVAEYIRQNRKISVTKVNVIADKPDRDWTDSSWGWVDADAVMASPVQMKDPQHSEKCFLILPQPIDIRNIQ